MVQSDVTVAVVFAFHSVFVVIGVVACVCVVVTLRDGHGVREVCAVLVVCCAVVFECHGFVAVTVHAMDLCGCGRAQSVQEYDCHYSY